jgi:hypothetical protein
MRPQFTLTLRDIERFWANVNKDGPLIRPELGPCWLWRGGHSSRGYGQMSFWPRHHEYAHRVAYLIAYGILIDNSCHRCDYPPCCNPAHLFDGTQKENLADARDKGRLNPRFIVNEAIVDEIRRIRPSGRVRLAPDDPRSLQTLAARFGLSESQVSMIVRGKRR